MLNEAEPVFSNAEALSHEGSVSRANQATLLLGSFSLNELSHLLAILQHGSLRKVSTRDSVSMSKLSKLLRSAEDALGALLFLRNGANMVPTPLSLQLRRSLERVLQSAADLDRDGETTEQHLAVAFDPLISKGMQDWSTHVRAKRMRVLGVSSEFAGDFARQGTFDVGFFFSPVNPPLQWHSEALGRIPFSFVRTLVSSNIEPIHAFTGMLTRQGLMRRRFLPTRFHTPAGPDLEIQETSMLLQIMRTRPCIACIPSFLINNETLVDFEVLENKTYQSFDSELIAMCDDERVAANVYSQLCKQAIRLVQPD